MFVFAHNDLAAKRVQLEELEGEHVDVPSLLAQFHLQGCHCYDPNEEHKIRSVIKECGEGSFESNIRELGKTISSARTHTKTTLDGVMDSISEQRMAITSPNQRAENEPILIPPTKK